MRVEIVNPVHVVAIVGGVLMFAVAIAGVVLIFRGRPNIENMIPTYPKSICVWWIDENTLDWETSCGFICIPEFDDNTVVERFKFCPYCGKPLEVKP